MNKSFILTWIFLITAVLCFSQQKVNSLKLDFFDKIPLQIDGCSELYTYDSTSLNSSKYIFVTNYQDLAFIKVNGKQIALKTISKKELSNKNFVNIYKGSGYTVVLRTKTLKKSGDEVWLEGGTVEVVHGSDNLLIKVHGESGC